VLGRGRSGTRLTLTDPSSRSLVDARVSVKARRRSGMSAAGAAYPRHVTDHRPGDAPALTHVDAAGAARMVDVSGKDVTTRRAVAAGAVRTTAEVVGLLRAGALPKGDALAVARIAGIMAAKRTPDLIPLCHPIALHSVEVVVEPAGDTIEITATLRTADRTGVEMEALTAVAVAGLTVIDMIKAVDPAASLDRVRVLAKDGGKTGAWRRGDGDDAVPDRG
jgi:cyclic pyranopterin phosphate synthase